PDVELSRDFLSYLQPGGVKAAFRQRAKEHHPDLHDTADPLHVSRTTRRFREVTEAYRLFGRFFKERATGDEYPHPQNPKQARPAAGGTAEPVYHAGAIPNRPLEFGRYLYYRQVIPYQALIQALSWQRQQRPAIGRIAVNWGWLDTATVQAILGNRSIHGRFGDRAIHLGLLRASQVRTLLAFQRASQSKLGSYFVNAGYLTNSELARLLADLHHHNLRLSGRRQQVDTTTANASR
ncbi:MAG TPA: J domain-containing protein, partial [Geobacteraceae bacterium]